MGVKHMSNLWIIDLILETPTADEYENKQLLILNLWVPNMKYEDGVRWDVTNAHLKTG